MTKQLWTNEELKDLISYAKEMHELNETLRAQLIAMNAKLQNEESKVKWCKQQLQILMNKNRHNETND